MIQQFIVGAVQGITEWLPVSSQGIIVLLETNFFNPDEGISAAIRYALFLHLGTFIAALIYFRRDVLRLLKGLGRYKDAGAEDRNVLKFLIVSTAISGICGMALLRALAAFEQQAAFGTKIITGFIGLLLVVTAIMEIRARHHGYRKERDLSLKDGILLGIVQGFSALPGLSRSGLTVSTFLLRRYDKTTALKISFLMSLPVVLLGNIALHWNMAAFQVEALWGVVFSFLFGILTIHALLAFARKINFGYFVLTFAALTFISIVR